MSAPNSAQGNAEFGEEYQLLEPDTTRQLRTGKLSSRLLKLFYGTDQYANDQLSFRLEWWRSLAPGKYLLLTDLVGGLIPQPRAGEKHSCQRKYVSFTIDVRCLPIITNVKASRQLESSDRRNFSFQNETPPYGY